MAVRSAITTSLLLAWTAALLAGPAVAQEMACQGAASATCTLDEGWIRGPEGEMWARFEWVDGKPVYQGDIVVEVLPTVSGDAVRKSAIVAGPIDTWSDGVIPYVIDSALSSQGRVDDAISHWNGKTGVTGVTLVPRTTQTDYVRFIPADGCWSYVGRTGGVQDIGLASGYSSFSGVVLVGSYQENGGSGSGSSEWMGHSVFKASAKKLGKTSWEGTSQMAIEGNGTFSYTGPKGTTLTGPISQDGKKLYMALDNGSMEVLEEKMADMVWDEMTLSGLNPGWVDVEIDPWSVKLNAKLSPGKDGGRSPIKVKLSVKAWIDTGIGSSKGKLQSKMTLYEP